MNQIAHGSAGGNGLCLCGASWTAAHEDTFRRQVNGCDIEPSLRGAFVGLAYCHTHRLWYREGETCPMNSDTHRQASADLTEMGRAIDIALDSLKLAKHDVCSSFCQNEQRKTFAKRGPFYARPPHCARCEALQDTIAKLEAV